jgi:hypothetical protein
MVWSPSINPEGAAERFKYSVGEADFFLNFAQFLYQDTNPTQTSPGFFSSLAGYTGSNLPFLLAWQGGVDAHFTKKVDFKVAPVVYNHVGGPVNTTTSTEIPDFGGTYIGQGTTAGFSGYPNGNYDGFYDNQTGINDLLVLEIPFELNYKMNKYDLRLFGDYAQNLDGAKRAEAAYVAEQSPLLSGLGLAQIPSAQTHDDKAYQIGFAIGSKNSLGLVNGSTSAKNAWEFRTYWQHIEQYSLDPNLLDTDMFEGDENLQGIYAAIAYGFTDNFIATIRYGYATRINDKLGTGGSGQDIPQMNPINQFNLVQMDLTFRF